MGVIAGIAVVYTGIEKNFLNDLARCSAIVASILLNFRKYINIKKVITIYPARFFQKKEKYYCK